MYSVVIAEDDDISARVMVASLKNSGYDVLRFKNGAEVLAYLREGNKADILLTDVLMPQMSGFELIVKLKSENILPPTMVVTGKQRESDALEAFHHGVMDYVAKPVSPKILLAKVNAIINMTQRTGKTA